MIHFIQFFQSWVLVLVSWVFRTVFLSFTENVIGSPVLDQLISYN